MVDPKISVVIPVYNEKATIDEILRRVLDTDGRKEIVIVDDCSTDGTRQILKEMERRGVEGEGASPAQENRRSAGLPGPPCLFQGGEPGEGGGGASALWV